MLPIAGEIALWGGEVTTDAEKKFETSGWLICDGRAVERKKYPELFAAIGTRYSAGQAVIPENFLLPDFGGRSPLGANPDDAAKRNKLSPRKVGASLGEERHQLTIAELPRHVHPAQGFGGNDGGRVDRGDALYASDNRGTGSTGEDQPHNNMQPSLTVTFLIRYRAG
jgi:microcystin-dependent protein